jgi:soluble lytic murein transglycosylase
VVLRLLPAAAFLTVVSAHPSWAGTSLSEYLDEAGAAAQALDDGDPYRAERAARRALAALPAGEAGARARLLLGLALDAGGHAQAAWPVLREAVPGLPDSLRGAATLRLGAALARSNHPGAAAAAIAESATASAGAALAEAEALLAAGLPGPAARALAGATSPSARLALARAMRALGDPRGGGILLALWVEHAGAREGEEAGRERDAWIRAGGPLSPPRAADRLARAERLLASARPALALAEVERADGDPPGPSSRSRLLRALALLQLGRTSAAEEVARDLAGRDGAGEDGRAAEWVLARAASRLGRLDEAAARYRRVAATRPAIPGLPPRQADVAEESAYLAAWLPYDAGRFAEAARELARFARESPGARRAADARWFHAWSLYRLGRRAEARAAFRALAAAESGTLRAGALYWQARLAAPARAAPLLRAAHRESPEGWYGLLASSRLADLGLAPDRPPLPAGAAPRAPAPEVAEALRLAAELLGAGLRAEGIALLDRWSRGTGAADRAAAVAEVAAFAGDARIPYRMTRDHLPPTRRTERWAFPDAFAPALRPAAAALGVDPSLALAVMRRESEFDAGARSEAAAEGILQLRPETAERVAAILGLPAPADGSLRDPAVAIGLGLAYLGFLGSRFPDVPVLVAAYNAGPAAGAWAWGVPLDEWVENIPYRETRQYVRAVLGDWAHYRRVLGELPPALEAGRPVAPPLEGASF